MKHVVLLFAIFSFFSLNAQDCPPGDVFINDQAQADAFVTQYPNCTEITGWLSFSTAEQIDVTTSFANIEHIEGDLNISSVEVKGVFASLDTVMGDINVSDHIADGNNHYGQLSASFPSLRYIGGNMVADESEGGAYLEGVFPVLERIEGGVYACGWGAASVYCVNCLNLEYIGGDITTPAGGLNYVDTIMGTIDYQPCYEIPLAHGEGTSGYNELKYLGGNLILGGNSLERLEDISGFQQLNTIAGDFICSNWDGFPDTTEITGLGQLKHVRSIDISYYNLTNLNFLSQLEVVDNNFRIRNNEKLVDISGLNHFITIGGELTIENNIQLSGCNVQAVCDHISGNGVTVIFDNIAGCNSVEEIQVLCPSVECLPDGITFTSQAEIDNFGLNYPGCVAIQGAVTIEETVQDDITNLDGLAQVGVIYGSLIIQNNNVLSDISALNNLDYISITDLQILNNNSLSQCDITSICNYFFISGTATIGNNASGCNTVTEIVDACSPGACPPDNLVLETQYEMEAYFFTYPGCTQINGNLVIGRYNSDIDDFSSLSNIESVAGNLYLRKTNATNLEGLNNLQTIGEDFIMGGGENLSDISALSNLHTIGGHIRLRYNPALTNLDGLHNISNFDGNCEINNNDALVSFSNLAVNPNRFIIRGNDALTDLNGLEQLDTVDYFIEIEDNDNLVTLEGLQLRNVDDIYIEENQNLISIQGLHNLESVDGRFYIRNNPNLSECAVQPVCEHLADNSPATIANNALGCNSLEEVDTACQTFLPIEMTAPLRVHLKNKTAILQWRTATEINNAGFDIQRSKAGTEWEKITWQVGQGNTSTPHSYTYTDRNPLSGTSYYRLKQIDFDGQFEYSNIVSLRYSLPIADIFPNPTDGKFHVKSTAQGKYQIHDTTGRIIQSGELENDFSIDISEETQGVYFISIQMDNEMITKRIIKM